MTSARRRAACPGSALVATSCTTNSDSRSRASRTLMLRLARIATANADCAAVTNSSSRCSASSGSPWWVADEIANTIGSVPTSSVHWLTFDDTSAPSPAFVLSRHANIPAISSSGASDASGASHFTRRNVLTPNSSPVATSDSANRSAHNRMTRGRGDEQPHDREPAPARRQPPDDQCASRRATCSSAGARATRTR